MEKAGGGRRAHETAIAHIHPPPRFLWWTGPRHGCRSIHPDHGPRACARTCACTRMETSAHRRLKSLAIEWLFDLGCRAVAPEVACPIGRYRVDVAGWLDHVEEDDLPPADPAWRTSHPAGATVGDAPGAGEVPGAGKESRCDVQAGLFPAEIADRTSKRPARVAGPRRPRIVVVECKQSRTDFFRNHVGRDAMLAERDRLERLARRIEERRIKRHEPHLRRTEAGLFEDRETWNFAGTSIGAYHRVRSRLERLERELYGRSKFDLLVRYRLADHLLVLCPRGLVRPREVPTAWGLLECSRRQRLGRPDPGEILRTRRRSERLDSDEDRRRRFLRNIAAAASRAALKSGAYDY